MQIFADSAAFLRNHNPPLPLDLAEVGPAIGINKEQTEKIEVVFGTALWLSDMLLHSMSIGIRRVNYQQITGGSLSLWQPIDWQGKRARVDPKYYGQLFAAEFVGKDKGVKVQELKVGKEREETLSTYAAWSAKGELLRVAVVNLEEWNNGTEHAGKRSKVTAKFGAPQGWEKVEVRRLESLAGAAGSSEKDISYAGVTYTYQNMGKGEKRKGAEKETIVVKDGTVAVDVKASEAVMIMKAT
jgi:hypothetical protein